MRIFLFSPHVFFRFLFKSCMFNNGLYTLRYFFKLLLIFRTWLFHWRSYWSSPVISVFISLVLHFNSDVVFFEKRLRNIVNSVFIFSQTSQFKKIVLEYLSSFFFHINFFSIPIAKLAKIDPILCFRIFTESQNILAVRTWKTKDAFTCFNCIFWYSFARSALVSWKLRNGTIVATIRGTVQASKSLFLEDRSVAFTL